jgi:hypothetical protein
MCPRCDAEVARKNVDAPYRVNALPDVIIIGAKLVQCPGCQGYYFSDPAHYRYMTRRIASSIALRPGRLTDSEKLLILLRFKNRVAPEMAHMSEGAEAKYRALLSAVPVSQMMAIMAMSRSETFTITL